MGFNKLRGNLGSGRKDAICGVNSPTRLSPPHAFALILCGKSWEGEVADGMKSSISKLESLFRSVDCITAVLRASYSNCSQLATD